VDRLFLDANVLFSSAYRPEGGVRRLWDLAKVRLATSHYAVQEASRNLKTPEQRDRLRQLLEAVEVVPELLLPRDLAASVELADEDLPILAGALAAGATHLITGDRRHFGRYYGQRLHGVQVMTPAQYLRSRGER
jgi:predicted nucleic acid-binding protein